MRSLPSPSLIAIVALHLALTPAAFATDAHHPAAASAKPAGAAAALATGEVKKVDKSASKITIKHGPIASLDMPPMTMVFRVKDAAMLDQVKPGDKISFVAESVNGTYTVTRLEAGK